MTTIPNGKPVRVAIVVAPLVLAAAGLAVATIFNDSDDHWVAAMVGWIAGWVFSLVAVGGWEVIHGRGVFGRPDSNQPKWRRSEVLILALLVTAATLLRLVAIEDYPVALHNDEMSCLLEARGFLDSDTAIFDVGWFSCPNLGFFITSIPVRILGPTLLALRVSSVLFALLSLIAVYLLVRRLFGVRPAVLLLILTVPFHWHLHFSRTGFHYMQAVSLTAVSVLIFVVAVDRRSPVLFGCAGLVVGIAAQTYYAAWIIPFILLAWTLARVLSDRREGKTVAIGFLVTMVFAVIATAPLLAHYLEKPDGAISRSSAVFLFSEESRQHVAYSYGTSQPAQMLARNASRIVRLFVGGAGDTAVQYGLQDRFIDPFILPLFLAGLAYALTLIRNPGGQLLWIWFLGTIVAGGLLTIDAPFSPRLTGVTPIILLFPVLLMDRILRLRWSRSKVFLTAVGVVFGGLLIASGWWNFHTYFVRHNDMSTIWPRDYIVRVASGLGNVRTIANFTDAEKFNHQAYRALVPTALGHNMSPASIHLEHSIETVKSFGTRTLVVYPLGDDDFIDFCDRVGGDRGGVVIIDHSVDSFEWCLVE